MDYMDKFDDTLYHDLGMLQPPSYVYVNYRCIPTYSMF